jgi:hypothetical protein
LNYYAAQCCGAQTPRFYFHTRVGDELMTDEVGVELPDIDAAKDAARVRGHRSYSVNVAVLATSLHFPGVNWLNSDFIAD